MTINETWHQFGEVNGETLYLCPINEYENIPVGTKLTDIFGNTAVKGSILIDMDTRGGFLAWGILDQPHNKFRSIDDKWDN